MNEWAKGSTNESIQNAIEHDAYKQEGNWYRREYINLSGTDLVTNGSPLQTALIKKIIYANFVESS